MEKKDVIEFFDGIAPKWDGMQADRSRVIAKILDNAGIAAGQRVLDVASGTGILTPFYLERGVSAVTAVDISPEMVLRAGEKYGALPQVSLCCGDIEEMRFAEPFDAAVVYNAFPHFEDGRHLISTLAGMLRPGGRLTVAHGFSRETINAHHKGAARHVSMGLVSVEVLQAYFEPLFEVDTAISNAEMYQVCGTKRRA